MPRIKPFKGVLYNQNLPLSKVMSPPYDVISPQEYNKLYNLHPANAIRLILGKKYSKDNQKHNRYTRSARTYKKWLKQKILLVDAVPSIYICKSTYKEGGKKKTRLGFIAAASLRGDKNKLLPHERTFAGPKRDRLKLMRACRTNFSQIFTLYSDPKKRVTKLLKPLMAKKPHFKAKYKDEEHFIWKLSDIKIIDKIAEIMRNKDIFIADGHHRYAVARAFSHPFIMLYLSNMDEKDGLSILPTHRKVKESAIKEDRLEILKNYFRVISKKSIPDAVKILKKNRRAFGLLTKDKRVKIFILKNNSFMTKFIKGAVSSTKKNLAPTILDEGVLKGILKIKNFEKNVSYTRDVKEATFLLPPATIGELKKIACAGEKMPHKSTYFYPKLLSGLVIYDQERS